VNRGTEKFTGTYSIQKRALTHEHDTYTCTTLLFEVHLNLLQKSVFAHVCCADIHIHGVHMPLSKNPDPNGLLLTFTKQNRQHPS